MKQIALSRGLFTKVDDEDYEALIKEGKWSAFDCRGTFYAGRKCSRRGLIMMARFLVKPAQGLQVDHINGDTLDNQKSNLRAVNRVQNLLNRHNIAKNNKTGTTGVFRDKTGGYVVHYRRRYIGYFKNLADAVAARKAVEIANAADR